MARETVKELGIEVFSDKQNVSSIRCRQGQGKRAMKDGAWARAELRRLEAEGLAGGSLSQYVYTLCPGLFSRIAQVILGR